MTSVFQVMSIVPLADRVESLGAHRLLSRPLENKIQAAPILTRAGWGRPGRIDDGGTMHRKLEGNFVEGTQTVVADVHVRDG